MVFSAMSSRKRHRDASRSANDNDETKLYETKYGLSQYHRAMCTVRESPSLLQRILSHLTHSCKHVMDSRNKVESVRQVISQRLYGRLYRTIQNYIRRMVQLE